MSNCEIPLYHQKQFGPKQSRRAVTKLGGPELTFTDYYIYYTAQLNFIAFAMATNDTEVYYTIIRVTSVISEGTTAMRLDPHPVT